MFTRKSISLIAVLTALAALAVGATSAWATKVTPANTAVTATSTNSKFIPANAYSEAFLTCKTSTAKTTTPAESGPPPLNNMNRGPEPTYGEGGAVGTFSTGPGSVLMNLTEAPQFKECGAFIGETQIAGVTVATSGGWSLAAYAVNQPQPEEVSIAAISVPKEGAILTVAGAINCVLRVAPDGTNVVTADYINGAAQQLQVDGQIFFKEDAGGTCGLGGASPAQFEGDYALNPAVEVNR